jgi:hypothetical protein
MAVKKPKRVRKATPKIMKLLKLMYERGDVSLDICPHCAVRMDYFDHGKCHACGKGCGCSFNPTSNSDFCDLHR